MENDSFLARLGKLDIRIFFWILLILTAIPYVRPLGIPISISVQVKDFHKTLDELEAGDVIIMEQGYTPTNYAMLPGGPALFKYLTVIFPEEHGGRLKIVLKSSGEVGPVGWSEKVEDYFKEAGWEYGVDYVYLGYIPGQETAIANLADGVNTIVAVDYYGNSMADLEMMKDINDYRDVSAVISVDASDYPDWYAKHWSSKGVPFVDMGPGPYYARWNTLYTQGILQGLIGTGRAAAEYELLLGIPGEAVASADTLSATHLFMILAIILGNLSVIGRGSKKIGGEI
ncbi:hypothetical protein ACFL0D_07860 [Thermoproteota archaeon]